VIGRTLSHYRVTAALGAGGMGEVYRATDTALGRDVAIKVLPAEVAQDPERLARFKREAQLLAALNHPHIAAIHGLEESDGKPFLVLELVEGEDLAERLKRGAIPVDETVAIAKQIAEALEAAHEKGIVHRDLKPANVKLTPEESNRRHADFQIRPGTRRRRTMTLRDSRCGTKPDAWVAVRCRGEGRLRLRRGQLGDRRRSPLVEDRG